MSGVAALVDVRLRGIVIVGLWPQLLPTTAEHVKLIVYVDGAPVGTGGGGGLSAMIAISAAAAACAGDARSASDHSTAPDSTATRTSAARDPKPHQELLRVDKDLPFPKVAARILPKAHVAGCELLRKPQQRVLSGTA